MALHKHSCYDAAIEHYLDTLCNRDHLAETLIADGTATREELQRDVEDAEDRLRAFGIDPTTIER